MNGFANENSTEAPKLHAEHFSSRKVLNTKMFQKVYMDLEELRDFI